MLPSPESAAQIEEWRNLAMSNSLTKEQSIEIIAHLRRQRGEIVEKEAAAAAKPAKTPKTPAAKKPKLSGDDLLAGLDDF
jgi:hypothetical protein